MVFDYFTGIWGPGYIGHIEFLVWPPLNPPEGATF